MAQITPFLRAQAALAGRSVAEPIPAFTWDFAPANNTEELLSCSTYSLLITANASLDRVQYNLHAFSPNVNPINADVGNNASGLQWRIPYSQSNVQMLLGMVDSNGRSGEVKGPFDVNGSAEDSSCIPVGGSMTPNFKVTTNVTTPKSCEPVGIFISGGSPPYNATIVIEEAGIISRAMKGKDDLYTWFNVAPLGRRAIFSATDRQGRLAASSSIITSAGDSVTCRSRSYSSKYKRPWSTVRKVFYYIGIFMPISLFVILFALYLPVLIPYYIYVGMKKLATFLHRVARCGDEETGTAIGEDIDLMETRPHTPVESMHQPNEDGQPDTPMSATLLMVGRPTARSSKNPTHDLE